MITLGKKSCIQKQKYFNYLMNGNNYHNKEELQSYLKKIIKAIFEQKWMSFKMNSKSS